MGDRGAGVGIFGTTGLEVPSRPPPSLMSPQRQSTLSAEGKPRSNPILSTLKFLLFASASGISVVACLILFGMWRTGARFSQMVEAMVSVPSTDEPRVEVASVVVEQIRGASELTTAVFAMEAIVPVEQDRRVGNFTVGTTRLLYIAHGEVRAGVDLDKLSSDRIQIDDKTITVRLPAPEILDSKIDIEQSQVYDYDRGFFNAGPDAAIALQSFAQQEALDKIRTSACEKEILDRANERAELTVTQLLMSAGYQQVSVKTSAPNPGSCS